MLKIFHIFKQYEIWWNKYEMLMLGARTITALKDDKSNVRDFWHKIVVFKRYNLPSVISNIKNHCNKP